MKKLLRFVKRFFETKIDRNCVDLGEIFPYGLTSKNAHRGLWFHFKHKSAFTNGHMHGLHPYGGDYYGVVEKVSSRSILISFYTELGPVYFAWVKVIENGKTPECFLNKGCTRLVPFGRDEFLDRHFAERLKSIPA